MDNNKVYSKDETFDVNPVVDIKAFLAEEEVKLAKDLQFVAERKEKAKELKIKTIFTGVVIVLSAILSSAYALGTQYDREKARKYEAAQELQKREMYDDAIEVYDRLYGYKNSDSLMNECKTKKAEAGLKKTYENALKRFEEKDYQAAAVLFLKAKDYEDAKEKALESYYKYGEVCVQKGEYENAHGAFKNAGAYKDAGEMVEKYKFAVVNAGDTLTLGKYEQDGDTANGAEDIEWYVLYKEGNQALLLSRYVLANMPFQEAAPSTTPDQAAAATVVNTYADSTIRTFVNETFYNMAFSEEEKNKIVPLKITEKDAQGKELAVSDNHAFLLSAEMGNQYLTRASVKTAKATKAINSTATYSNGKMSWWTCSVDPASRTAARGATASVVSANGYAGNYMLHTTCGVRPAIWVDFVK